MKSLFKASEVNKLTGEVIEYAPANETELVTVYRQVTEQIKTLTSIKQKLAKIAEAYIGVNGTSEPIDGYQFRASIIQRSNYDKTVMHEVFDEDVLDLMLEPNKKAVDDYIKENLETLGADASRLRKSMIDVGKPYRVIKLENLKRRSAA